MINLTRRTHIVPRREGRRILLTCSVMKKVIIQQQICKLFSIKENTILHHQKMDILKFLYTKSALSTPLPLNPKHTKLVSFPKDTS